MPLYSAPTNADVQEAILKAQAAAEQSQAVVQQSILIQQSVQQEAADQAMATAAATQAVSEQVAEPVADVSLAVGADYVRANPSINQYAFSGCYANDAPDSGHCRPQINSAQGWSSVSQNSGWMSIDLQGATRVAGILLQVSVKNRKRALQISIMEPKPQLTGPQQQLRLQPVAQVRPTRLFVCHFLTPSLPPLYRRSRVAIFTSPDNVNWISKVIFTCACQRFHIDTLARENLPAILIKTLLSTSYFLKQRSLVTSKSSSSHSMHTVQRVGTLHVYTLALTKCSP